MAVARALLAIAGGVLAAGCEDRMIESPTPQYYAWPAQLNYRFEHVAELQRDARAVQRFETLKVLKLTVRDDQYVLVYDSVLKTSVAAGQPPQLAPYLPEDTLAFHVSLGRRGEISRVMAGCDPALAACAAALPSAVAMELRRIVPGLPLWPVPPRGSWVDTLRFDDTSRPNGTRGSFVTTYGPVRDTTIGGIRYWMLPWHAVKVAFHRPPDGAGFLPERPTESDGLALIDRQRLLPVFATWAGAVPAPEGLRAIGIEASAFRARAYLTGTPFDSAFSARAEPAQPRRDPP